MRLLIFFTLVFGVLELVGCKERDSSNQSGTKAVAGLAKDKYSYWGDKNRTYILGDRGYAYNDTVSPYTREKIETGREVVDDKRILFPFKVLQENTELRIGVRHRGLDQEIDVSIYLQGEKKEKVGSFQIAPSFEFQASSLQSWFLGSRSKRKIYQPGIYHFEIESPELSFRGQMNGIDDFEFQPFILNPSSEIKVLEASVIEIYNR